MSRTLADNPLEDNSKMRLRAEAHHGGYIGYRQPWIEKELLGTFHLPSQDVVRGGISSCRPKLVGKVHATQAGGIADFS